MLARPLCLVALTLALGGCMFFTPATGVCVTGPCRDFETNRQAVANQPTQAPTPVYEVADFKLSYISAWGPLSSSQKDATGKDVLLPLVDVTSASGVSTLRIAVGRPIALENGSRVSEGIRVLTINRGFEGLDEASAKASLANLARQFVAVSFSDSPTIEESEAPLGGKPGYQAVMRGTSVDVKIVMRHAVRAVLHRNRGYVVEVFTPDELYTQAPEAYLGVFAGFQLKDADPVYPSPAPTAPTPTGSPTPQASSSAAVSPSPGPTGSPAAVASTPLPSLAP